MLYKDYNSPLPPHINQKNEIFYYILKIVRALSAEPSRRFAVTHRGELPVTLFSSINSPVVAAVRMKSHLSLVTVAEIAILFWVYLLYLSLYFHLLSCQLKFLQIMSVHSSSSHQKSHLHPSSPSFFIPIQRIKGVYTGEIQVTRMTTPSVTRRHFKNPQRMLDITCIFWGSLFL